MAYKKTVPSWVTYKPKEVEQLIVKLAKAGNQPEKIGLILRDTYGIPNIKPIIGKTITQVLKEANIAPKLPSDLTNLIKRVVSLSKHLETHKKDQTAKRGLMLTEGKIKRLVKYYKKEKVLPDTWHYTRENAKLLIE